jgi:circadian clock protein KaiB
MTSAARKHQAPEAVASRGRPHLHAESSRTGTTPEALPYRLRLYVAGRLPNSVQALDNLLDICRTYLEGRHTLEVVDYLEHPRQALEDGIIATPTLLKMAPGEACMVVGTLADRPMVLQALGIGEEK